MQHRQGRLWRGPFPTRRSTFQAPQNGRRDPAQAGHPVNLIGRHEVRQQQRHASVTTYRTAATEGRLWRGHSRPAQPHGNSISIVHRVHRTAATEDVATLLDVGTAVYGKGHSRPAQLHSRPSTAAGENAPSQDMPPLPDFTLDWVRGVESASLVVIGNALVRPAVAFQPPSHSSKPLSPVVP